MSSSGGWWRSKAHQPASFYAKRDLVPQSLWSRGHQGPRPSSRRSPGPWVSAQRTLHPSLFLTCAPPQTWFCPVSSSIYLWSPHITTPCPPPRSTEPETSPACPASQEEKLTNARVKPGPSAEPQNRPQAQPNIQPICVWVQVTIVWFNSSVLTQSMWFYADRPTMPTIISKITVSPDSFSDLSTSSCPKLADMKMQDFKYMCQK